MRLMCKRVELSLGWGVKVCSFRPFVALVRRANQSVDKHANERHAEHAFEERQLGCPQQRGAPWGIQPQPGHPLASPTT